MKRTLYALLLLLAIAPAAAAQAPHPYLNPDRSISRPTNATRLEAGHFDRAFWASSAVYATAVSFDVWTTHRAIGRGLIEGNPVFSRKDGSFRTGANLLYSGAVYAGAAWLETTGRRRWARVLLLVGAGIRFGAGAHNLSITPPHP